MADHLKDLTHAAHVNARRAEEEVVKGDFLMAEGHALLAAQKSAEVYRLLVRQNTEGAPS